jgi:hypothetical protein
MLKDATLTTHQFFRSLHDTLWRTCEERRSLGWPLELSWSHAEVRKCPLWSRLTGQQLAGVLELSPESGGWSIAGGSQEDKGEEKCEDAQHYNASLPW